jgi:hypothetical protein
MKMSKYKLTGFDATNNRIKVENNTCPGESMELDLAFIMRSGRVSRFFSIEDRIILNRIFDGEVEIVDAPHQAFVRHLRSVA